MLKERGENAERTAKLESLSEQLDALDRNAAVEASLPFLWGRLSSLLPVPGALADALSQVPVGNNPQVEMLLLKVGANG